MDLLAPNLTARLKSAIHWLVRRLRRTTHSLTTKKFAVMIVAVTTAALGTHGVVFATGPFYSRPIPLGVCGSNMKVRCDGLCAGGTLGSTVKDSSGRQYILSNNHVIGRSNGAQPGDPV